MDFPHVLSEQLSALTNALDDPGIDLAAVLGDLTGDVTAAVPSFLGLSMTLLLDGRPVTLTTIDADLAAAAGASLLLPLDPLAGAGPGSSVVFYAGRPGAFVDLAADTRYAYGLDGDVVLDGHLTTLTRAAGVHPGVNRVQARDHGDQPSNRGAHRAGPPSGRGTRRAACPRC